MSASEVRPLVPQNNKNSKYGVYDDDYIPVDEDSRQIVRRRRFVKYGGLVVLLAAVVAAVAASSNSSQQQSLPRSDSNAAAVQADHLFAGLLADEEAFYFPTTLQEEQAHGGAGRRRMLRALKEEEATFSSGNPWAYDWTAQNAKDGAAVGEYYRAKGLAMADYYRSKYDPTYKAKVATTNVEQDTTDAAPEANDEDISAWTYDWKADMDRGIALGQHYKSIGDQINAHYREAFDPKYTSVASAEDDNDGQRRRLKTKEKKRRDQKKKELAANVAAHDEDGVTPTTGWYDWQADRDRGMAIGTHYKQMGEEIADHYNQEFNPMYDVNKKAYTDKNWATMWQDYQKRGQEISNYYKSKGAAIDKFYEGQDTLEAMASPMVDGTSNVKEKTSNSEVDASGNNPDAAYIWGLDWQKDREHAMAIHDDMMKKGLAIGNYYRSKHDPTYGGNGSVPADAHADLGNSAEEVVGEGDENAEPADAHTDLGNSAEEVAGEEADENAEDTAAAAPASHHPDLDYPPWGVDPEADREHGIALGQYWKQNRIAMGGTYKKRGMELGKYYENKYRSQFDPTYVAADEDAP